MKKAILNLIEGQNILREYFQPKVEAFCTKNPQYLERWQEVIDCDNDNVPIEIIGIENFQKGIQVRLFIEGRLDGEPYYAEGHIMLTFEEWEKIETN